MFLGLILKFFFYFKTLKFCKYWFCNESSSTYLTPLFRLSEVGSRFWFAISSWTVNSRPSSSWRESTVLCCHLKRFRARIAKAWYMRFTLIKFIRLVKFRRLKLSWSSLMFWRILNYGYMKSSHYIISLFRWNILNQYFKRTFKIWTCEIPLPVYYRTSHTVWLDIQNGRNYLRWIGNRT